MNRKTLLGHALVIVLSSVCGFSMRCNAQEVVAGWEGNSFSSDGGVSVIFPIPLSMNSAIIIRPTASYLQYDVRQVGVTTEVSAPGIALGVGYLYANERVTFDIGPAAQVLWERRKMLFGTTSEQTLYGWGLGSAISFLATPTTNLNLSASYDQANRYLLHARA